MTERDMDQMTTEEIADRLAASVLLLAYDAHPTYPNTSGWRGGIGGQALTQGCSLIDPPPNTDWTQFDLPTTVAREWLATRSVDIAAVKADLMAEWESMLHPAAPVDGSPDQPTEGSDRE